MEKFSQIVWTVSKYTSKVEPMTFADFLREYYSDETTSPRGVEPRLHISEQFKFELDEDSEENWNAPYSVYEVSEWGRGGQGRRTLETFETEEAAKEYILERWESNYQHEGGQACFDTENEAFEYLAFIHGMPRSVGMKKVA